MDKDLTPPKTAPTDSYKKYQEDKKYHTGLVRLVLFMGLAYIGYIFADIFEDFGKTVSGTVDGNTMLTVVLITIVPYLLGMLAGVAWMADAGKHAPATGGYVKDPNVGRLQGTVIEKKGESDEKAS